MALTGKAHTSFCENELFCLQIIRQSTHISVCAALLCGSEVKSRVRDLQVPDSSLTGIKGFVLGQDTSKLQPGRPRGETMEQLA